MKITELQIGDWIHIEDESWNVNINARVREIEKNDEDYGVIVNERGLVFFDDTVTPIPITAEILEKNGFETRGDWAMYFTTEDYDVLWRTDTNPTPHLTIESMTRRIGNFRSYNCNNVHELQHALRLCGLNELADNFKI